MSQSIYDAPTSTDGAWLSSVPYGGGPLVGQGQPGPSQPQTFPGPAPIQPYGQEMTAAILIGGLLLISGGGALLGWLLTSTKTGALIGALGGLSYSAANLAWNTSQLQGRPQ